jgi:hypothetical protein
MWAMQKFRQYLLGRKFVARVDHKPLVAMLSNKMNLMMEGWIDTIQCFDFITEYLPGETNVLADALSRSHDVVASVIQVRNTGVEIETSSLDLEASAMWQAEKRGKKIPTVKERQRLIGEIHALGHFSVETMFRKLWHRDYWWPGIRQDLRELVSTCLECLRFDIRQLGFHPAQSIEADKPWDHVQMDLVGPLQQAPLESAGYSRQWMYSLAMWY